MPMITHTIAKRALGRPRVLLNALCVAGLMLCSPAASHGQPRYVNLAPEAMQLVPWQGTVSAAAVDGRGFLLLGTTRGLFRFDGVSFRQLGRTTIVGAVSALSVGPEGDVWVGTGDGKLFFRSEDRHADQRDFTPVAQVQVGASLTHLVQAQRGVAWLLCSGKVFQASAAQHTIVQQRDSPLGNVQSLVRDRSNALWAATDRGLLHCGRQNFARCENVGPNQPLSGVIAGFGTGVLAHGPHSAFIAKDHQATPITEEIHEGVTPPIVGAVPFNGGTLIADADGLAWTDGLRLIRYRLPGVQGGSSVLALAEAPDGNIWLAIENLGLAQLHRQVEAQLLGVNLGERPEPAFSVAFDSAGQLWQNTGKALLRWDQGTWNAVRPPPAMDLYAMRSLAPTTLGEFWMATLDGGVIKAQNGNFTRITHAEEAPMHATSAVFQDATGKLWFAGAAFHSKTPTGEILYERSLSQQCGGKATAMVEWPKGVLWFATEDRGLCRYENGVVQIFGQDQGLPSSRLLSLFLGRNDTLWIGTEDRGLAAYRKGRFLALGDGATPGLSDVSSIIDDGHDGLWLGTGSGLIKLNLNDAEAVLDGGRTTIRYTRLAAADGLRNANFMARYPPTVARSARGSLYFPSHAGVVAINNPQAVKSPKLPDITFDQISVNGTARPLTGRLVNLAVGDTLEIEFTAPRLQWPHRVRFMHRLDGLESQWQTDMDSRIKYLGLPQGTFTLRLATTSSDQDATNEATLRIVVHPPFYKTTWFVALCTVCFVVAGVAAYRLRLWSLRARFETITKERTRIARDMHDTLEQNLVALKLQLEAVERFSQKPAAVAEHTQTALELVDQAMREAKSSIWALRAGLDEDVDLATSVSVCAGRALKGTELVFQLRVSGTPFRLQIEAEQQLIRIVQVALTNVVKHASAKTVTLELDFSRPALSVRLSDDGSGITNAQLPGVQEGHFGIQGIRERVASLGGTLQIDSAPEHGMQLSFTIAASWRRSPDNHG